MKKVAVLTIFRGNYNYGGMLQAYALPYVINKLGFEACQILFDGGINVMYSSRLQQCRQYSIVEIFNKLKERIIERKTFLIENNLKVRIQLFNQFVNSHINVSRYYSVEDIVQLGQDFDTYVVGSDQVWNPNVVNRFYMLDFPKRNHAQKISYAASIGRGYISKYEGERLRYYLDKFDAISVREESAKIMLMNANIKKRVEVLLDPTMLLSAKEWKEVCAERLIKDKYALLYSFSNCPFKEELNAYYNSLGYKVVFIPYAKQKYNTFDNNTTMSPMWNVGPSEFLSLINYADIVITDSFHGAVFSVIFNKQFFVFSRDKAKSKTSKNARLDDLLDQFSLDDRMIYGVDEIKEDKENIDFQKVNAKLEGLVERSKLWLQSVLNN